MRMRALSLGLAAACSLVLATGLASAKLTTPLVTEVRETLVTRYYKPVPPAVLRATTVEAMLAALGDPYTEYLTPSEVRELTRVVSGRYSGIGVTVSPRTAGLLVTSAPAGPAQRAGVRTGDLIVAIDGVSTAQLTLEQAVTRILGPRGTALRLGLRRGTRTLSVRIVRDLVSVPTVESRVVRIGNRQVGLIRVLRFAGGTAQSVEASALRFAASSVEGIVLDLRSNPGGVLDEAVGVVSVFQRGGVVATVSGAHEPKRTIRADRRTVVPDMPLVVLVDRWSASAAEVVAAALRDNDRAVVAGETTFGKATVQELAELRNGGALKVTIARYVTPRGRDL